MYEIYTFFFLQQTGYEYSIFGNIYSNYHYNYSKFKTQQKRTLINGNPRNFYTKVSQHGLCTLILNTFFQDFISMKSKRDFFLYHSSPNTLSQSCAIVSLLSRVFYDTFIIRVTLNLIGLNVCDYLLYSERKLALTL